MTAKHTPGPWFAEKNDSYWEVNPDKGGENELPFSVANVCSSAPGNRDGGLQEANARLIAAAPELLAALQLVAGEVTDYVRPTSADSHLPTDIVAVVHAAIAKAVQP